MASFCSRKNLFEKLMEDYIPISALNDFIFCPYSIYLHNVYMESDEGIYHAYPQVKGKGAHETIDTKSYSTRKNDMMSLPVCSERLRLIGRIDLYKQDRKILIERKFQLKRIYRGQLYQLWAQYVCMQEMEYKIDRLAFYETSTNKMIPIELPQKQEMLELETFIKNFREFHPDNPFLINPNKCTHCIYCNMCDKTDIDNVYTQGY